MTASKTAARVAHHCNNMVTATKMKAAPVNQLQKRLAGIHDGMSEEIYST